VNLGISAGSPPELELFGLTGRDYLIQYATSLQNGGNWQTLVTIPLTESPLTWQDTNATNSQRFYRAVLPP